MPNNTTPWDSPGQIPAPSNFRVNLSSVTAPPRAKASGPGNVLPYGSFKGGGSGNTTPYGSFKGKGNGADPLESLINNARSQPQPQWGERGVARGSGGAFQQSGGFGRYAQPGAQSRPAAASAPAPQPETRTAIQPPARAAAAGAVIGAGASVMRTPRGSAQSEQRAAMLGNAGMPQLAAAQPYTDGNLFGGMSPDGQRVMRSSFAGNEPALAESSVRSSMGFPSVSSGGQQAALASFGGNNPQAAQTGAKAPMQYDTTGLDANMAQWVRANENGPRSVQDGKTIVDRFMEQRGRGRDQVVSPFGAQNTPEAQELMSNAFKTGSPDFTGNGTSFPAGSVIDQSQLRAAYGEMPALSPARMQAPQGAAFGQEIGAANPFGGAPDVLSRSAGDPMVRDANFGQSYRANAMGDAPGNVPNPSEDMMRRAQAFQGVDPAISFAEGAGQLAPTLRGDDPVLKGANFGQASRMELTGENPAGLPAQSENENLYNRAFAAATGGRGWSRSF